VTLGLKPGVRDIGGSRYSDEILVGMADGWTRELRGLNEQLAGLVPPQGLADAHADFVTAFDDYVTTAGLLGDAARADGERRTELVGQAVEQGEAADEVFDRGAAVVQAAVTHAGLETIPWLPNPFQGADK
jgi:hypothetical protein